MIFTYHCKRCGALSTAGAINARYCAGCRIEVRRELQRKAYRKGANMITRETDSPLDRPFTSDTPFLCQKWYSEGMSAQQIADILGRSVSDVQKALREPLSTEHQQIVSECAPGKRVAG